MRRLYACQYRAIEGPVTDAPNGVERVRRKTGTSRDTPTQKEGSEEGTLERADEDNRLCRRGQRSTRSKTHVNVLSES